MECGRGVTVLPENGSDLTGSPLDVGPLSCRMAKNSQIEWTHHTFNPWWGCTKVSPACDNCYAELWARRVGQEIWGAGAPRRFFNDAHWREPLVWNEEARLAGQRARVFCASMADVFERRPELKDQRSRLWALIERTPLARLASPDEAAAKRRQHGALDGQLANQCLAWHERGEPGVYRAAAAVAAEASCGGALSVL